MNTSEVNYCHQHSRSLLLSNGWKYQILRLAGSVIHLGQHVLIACIYSTSRLLENPFSGQILTFLRLSLNFRKDAIPENTCINNVLNREKNKCVY